jgi:cyclophilin family peptidyl-prolyl cis-trans isomerase
MWRRSRHGKNISQDSVVKAATLWFCLTYHRVSGKTTYLSLKKSEISISPEEVAGMKKFSLSVAVLVLIVFGASVSSGELKAAKKFTPQEIKKMSQTTAVIETTLGAVTLKFFPEVAPGHVSNFIELAKKGFYDGTTFHRVIPGFMIQGGDPNSKNPDKKTHGTGGPGYTIKAEFSDKPHKRGTLSMARAQSPDSAGSQFFICVKDSSFLDRQYTVFGEVVSGMDVVDKIVSQPRDRNDNPNDRVEMKVKITEQK